MAKPIKRERQRPVKLNPDRLHSRIPFFGPSIPFFGITFCFLIREDTQKGSMSKAVIVRKSLLEKSILGGRKRNRMTFDKDNDFLMRSDHRTDILKLNFQRDTLPYAVHQILINRQIPCNQRLGSDNRSRSQNDIIIWLFFKKKRQILL